MNNNRDMVKRTNEPVRAEEDKGAFIVPVLFLALSFFLLVGTCKVEADADTEVEA